MSESLPGTATPAVGDCLSAIAPHPESDEWLFLTECPIRTGYGDGKWAGEGRDALRRIDAWAMNCFPSARHQIVAYEVKITRADFRHEIKVPRKRLPALRWSNRFYFVAPKGIIPVAELPVECGLLEVVWRGRQPHNPSWMSDWSYEKTVTAPWRDVQPPTWGFTAALLRQMRWQAERVAYHKAIADIKQEVAAGG